MVKVVTDQHFSLPVGLTLGAVLLVAVNIISAPLMNGLQLDLTQERLYTLSDGTREILHGLSEPVILRLFVSDRLAGRFPGMWRYANRVRGLLESYARTSGGMLRVITASIEPFSEEEEEVLRAGLRGIVLDESSGEQAYFGLIVTGPTDKREVIPVFSPTRESFLEYDVSQAVHSVSSLESSVVIGLITDTQMQSGTQSSQTRSYPWLTYEQISKSFEVRTLSTELEVIDEDVDVLLVARPLTLEDSAVYAIDQAVLRGTRALFFVDPFAEGHNQENSPPDQPPSGPNATLDNLFEGWGIDLNPEAFVADPELALSVNVNVIGVGTRVMPYPAWLKIDAAHMSDTDLVTADLKEINLASAGALGLREGSTLSLSKLLWSSGQAKLLAASALSASPDPQGMLEEVTRNRSDVAERVIAARFDGMLSTAFPDGAPTDSSEPSDHIAQSQGEVHMIVVADSDMLEDRYWVQVQNFFGQRIPFPFASNGDFIVNALDNLSGSSALIKLRTRSVSHRPFEVIEELRRDASQLFLTRERDLQTQIRAVRRRIAQLRDSGSGEGAVLSVQDQAEIDNAQTESVRLQRELRNVRRDLNRDIERLTSSAKVLNIGLVPLLIALLAVVLAPIRNRWRSQASTAD